jgi:hypothetical protein
MLFSLLGLQKGTVLKMISWKHSFKRLNEEYEIAKKKKQALDNLFESGRISQATRDSFDNDINAVISDIEKQQKDLFVKMQGKVQELESQIKTLETLLANYEIQHVVGEIDEEVYQREANLLSTGLESAKRELNTIKEATNQLCPPIEETVTETSLPAEENEAEIIQNELTVDVPSTPDEVGVITEPCLQEPAVTMEEAVPEQPEIECGCTIPAEMPQEVDEAPQEVVEEQPQVTEEISQIEETVEVTDDNPETTEDMPQIMNEVSEVASDNTEAVEDMSQDMNELPEIVVGDNPENTEEMPQNVEELPQEVEEQTQITEEISETFEETPNALENEPQEIEDSPQLIEEMPEEVHPSEAPEEAQQETTVEVIAEEETEAEEDVASAETDEDVEQEI